MSLGALKPQKNRMRYTEQHPDVTESGIGKSYSGYRIFFMEMGGLIERVYSNGEVKPATRDEIAAFKRVLVETAQTDQKVARYLDEHPELKLMEG